ISCSASATSCSSLTFSLLVMVPSLFFSSSWPRRRCLAAGNFSTFGGPAFFMYPNPVHATPAQTTKRACSHYNNWRYAFPYPVLSAFPVPPTLAASRKHFRSSEGRSGERGLAAGTVAAVLRHTGTARRARFQHRPGSTETEGDPSRQAEHEHEQRPEDTLR